jgi:hypothetical protein
LTSRIERIFSLANRAGDETWDETWDDGQYPYKIVMDLGSDWNHFMNEESLYCLPVLISKLYSRLEYFGTPIVTDCLLLKQLKPGVSEYMRVGLLKEPLDAYAYLPEEIRGVAGYAKSEIDSSDLVTITIV